MIGVVRSRDELLRYKGKCGVYLVRVGKRNIYVGASRNVHVRCGRLFCKGGLFQNCSWKLYVFLAKNGLPIEIRIKTVESKFELVELEKRWIERFKPEFNEKWDHSYESRLRI
jgi:excinuclease UvrABC nuclease subunit